MKARAKHWEEIISPNQSILLYTHAGNFDDTF